MEISESIFNQISDSDRSRTDFTSETQLHKVYPPLHCHFFYDSQRGSDYNEKYMKIAEDVAKSSTAANIR